MGLSDFERELATDKSTRESKAGSLRRRDEDGEHKHRHRHHHRTSHRRRDDSDDRSREEEERRKRHKRHRDRNDEEDVERRHRSKRRRSNSAKVTAEKTPVEAEIKVFDSEDDDDDEDGDEWVEKEEMTAPPEEDILDQRDQNLQEGKVQRDAWMQEPSALDIHHIASKEPQPARSQFVGAKGDHEFKVHESEVKQHLADLEKDFAEDSDNTDAKEEEEEEGGAIPVTSQPAQHEVSYTFGDSGSGWRMTKLKAVYRQAEESGKSVDDVAMGRYGELRDFDDAREEERELDRRKMYGREYVGLEKPSGELFQERKMRAGVRRESNDHEEDQEPAELPQGEMMIMEEAAAKTAPLDSTALNKLKAQVMKAKLRHAPNAAQLEEEYNLASQASLANPTPPNVVVLNNMDNRQLASGRGNEVTALSGKRARERGTVQENEDMSLEDMVRQERRGGKASEGRGLAERIAKDGKFVDDLEYMDDNAEKLSKKVVKSDSQLRNVAIEDFANMNKILDSCPLCHHEDRQPSDQSLPTAPIVSLATRTYLTLPPLPEITKTGGAVIVPLQHRLNLLECDEDEWEELRNFMKSLTRHYAALDQSVLFYENAAHTSSRNKNHTHATLNAIPLPPNLAALAPAYFKEAILSSDEQWSQHRPLIDTLAFSQRPGYGKLAFRKAMVSEMPYFHVWFTLDGGLGHVVEDERLWPKGDLFAREVLGGMLGREAGVVRREGRWGVGDARRVGGFRKGWEEWDWTNVLLEAGADK